jgi:uncharacterized protein
MLSFDLTTLESHAVQVDGRLSAEDAVWGEGEIRPVDSVHVTGRLSSAGASRFYFSGTLEGSVGSTCRRCLTAVVAPVREDVHLLFARAGDQEIDDPDVYVIGDRTRELDLRPSIREQWLLAAPAFVLCGDDCKGLCVQCGADLNEGPCGCEAARDDRWDALRNARSSP